MSITVKEYAEKNHVSAQSVYAKIKRKEKELQEHVYKRNGITFLDTAAEDILRPSAGNSKLSIKVRELQAELAEKTKEAEEYKRKNASLAKDCKELCDELNKANIELADNSVEKEKLNNRIAELTSEYMQKANAVFNILDDPKNAGITKKIIKQLPFGND